MAENQQYGGFWIRFLALLVDLAILTLAGLAIGAIVRFTLGPEATTIGSGVLLLVWALYFPLLYFPLMHASARQATFGKAMLGLKVTDCEGNRLSLLHAAGRYLATLISGAVFLIGYLVAAFTRRKQALHDLIASTLVVRERPARVGRALAVVVIFLVLPLTALPVLLGVRPACGPVTHDGEHAAGGKGSATAADGQARAEGCGATSGNEGGDGRGARGDQATLGLLERHGAR